MCCEGVSTAPEALLGTGCGCCRDGASAGKAHLHCVAKAAEHNFARWTHCPTCRQEWTGALELGLARARCEQLRHLPIDDTERCVASSNLAVALRFTGEPGAIAEATRIYEDLLAVWRQTLPDDDPLTLSAVGNLSIAHEQAGNTEAALLLAQESVAALRRVLADSRAEVSPPPPVHDTTNTARDPMMLATALGTASRLLAKAGSHAAARPMMEEALTVARSAREGDPVTVHAMSNLGVCLSNIGDMQAGFALKLEACRLSRRVLGVDHPQTQAVAEILARSQAGGEGKLCDARAIGRLVGLTAPGMNGALVFVLGYSEAKNRYLVALHDGLRGAKPLGIRPVNLVLKSGSAVVVQSHGKQALQRWEGK